MSTAMSELDFCGCCSADEPTPPIYNRPGLAALAYRCGTHPTVLQRMLQRLATQEIQLDSEQIPPDSKQSIRPLAKLNARAGDDPAIALLDAWATLADVLTFYQERIANEGYLRTATEPRSIVELVRTISYELNPGVAASTFLAFTVEDAVGAPGVATVPQGTKVKSIPAQEQRPQAFETSEEIQARAEWNALQPQLTEPVEWAQVTTEVYFKGIATNLKPGDGLLFVGSKRNFRRIQSVMTDTVGGYTKVTWGLSILHGLAAEYFAGIDLDPAQCKVQRVDQQVDFDWGEGSHDPAVPADIFSARWTGYVTPPSTGTYTFYTTSAGGVRLWVNDQQLINNWTDHAEKLDSGTIALVAGQMYPIKLEYYERTVGAKIQLFWSGPGQPGKAIIPHAYLYLDPAPEKKVYAFRQRAALFGYNAPDWRAVPDSIRASYLPHGLAAEYFEGIDLDLVDPKKKCKVQRTDEQVHFEWGAESPDQAIPADNFSVRWTGCITPPSTGTYTFYTISDDGVRLWVDRQLLIDNWTDHGPTPNSGTIALVAGQMYPIKMEYYEHGGTANIQLSWSGPGQPKAILPSVYLNPLPASAYDNWPGFSISSIASSATNTIYLDAAYLQITPGSWIVLSIPTYQEVYTVESTVEDSRANFTLTAKTTRVSLKGENLKEKFDTHVRDTVVFAQSELLELAEKPLSEPVYGDKIVLDRLVSGLAKDQTLIVSGKRGRVIINAQGLTLQSADGKSVTLNPGDRLQVIVHSDDNPSKWTLMNCDGFVGVVTAGSDQLTLQPADKEDTTVYEVAWVEKAEKTGADPDHTTLTLTTKPPQSPPQSMPTPLANYYDRTTVTINANVARATHGETVLNEVLGSGNGAQPNQRFTLQKPPLTYVSAPTASGGATTLKLRINDLLWQEVPSLYRLQADSKAYSVRLTAEGKPQVIFGDGEQGARLPTGVENVKATYCSGIGQDGMVAANQLTLLQTRPLGIRSVTNPLAATGAADRETPENARRNAPLKVLTLDRIVSLQDYADFARNFAGIGKAKAVAMWSGEERLVHLTVAAVTDKEIKEVDPTSDLHNNLVKEIDVQHDPGQRFEVVSFDLVRFSLMAHVLVDEPRYIRAEVLAEVRNSLLQAFAFTQREFGQPVTAAEVIAVIQQASQGVLAVRLDPVRPDPDPLKSLYPLKNDKTGETGTILLAPIASKPDEKTGLLLINPDGIELKEWNA